VPQGGVISPLLANLFLHYAIDMWAVRTIPDIPFCRYADDGLLHCVTEKQAHFVLGKLKSRLKECGLEINQSKSRIVYCKDANRKNEEEITKFDFLGYEFKGRLSRTKSKDGFFIGFNPAISSDRLKSLVHAVKYELKALRLTNISLQDVARSINPIVRGWLNYYGKFNPSMLERVVKAINRRLAHWARSKFKSLKRSMAKAWVFINKVRINSPKMFAHWDYYRSLTGAG
jgi:RNA-directed DNA polymerase